jgi:ribosomal peptide maturation radical SAM protein 1
MAFKVALVSMPWPLADRPSIQLAVLKAYLQQQAHGTVSIRAFHPYLRAAASLGLACYQAIAERSWLAEAMYAPLLFPEQLPQVQQLVRRENGRRRRRFCVDVAAVSGKLQTEHERSGLFDRLAEADLVGISVCLAQLSASLYVAREVKRRSPVTPIVFGGSMVCENIGKTVLRAFPEIDYMVNGEGEQPLLALVHRLQAREPENLEGIAGLVWRRPDGDIGGGGRCQQACLDDLPYPDFSDYFSELRQYPQLGNMIGQLPLESSRGCYWHRATPQEPQQACQFCNLNLQWRGYRTKNPERVVRELAHQVQKHKALRFFFVDNTLNPATITGLFETIQQLRCTLDLFAELRAPLTLQQVQQMRLAGLKQVQIGIESLSGQLLARMHKGTRVIENIEIMKRCEEFDIRNWSNLLLEFPGSDQQDVSETLAALEFVRCYRPLRLVRFWLGEGSPIQLQQQTYGLRAVRNHPWYRALFPDEILSQLTLMQKTYRGDQAWQKRLWRPVRQQVRRWERQYRAVQQHHGENPMLGYSDGGSFLVIRRRAVDSDQHEAFRLVGSSAEIYRHCDTHRTLADIESRFPQLSPPRILDFLHDLVEKRLMYREGCEYLSLAVNEDIRRFCGARQRGHQS